MTATSRPGWPVLRVRPGEVHQRRFAARRVERLRDAVQLVLFDGRQAHLAAPAVDIGEGAADVAGKKLILTVADWPWAAAAV